MALVHNIATQFYKNLSPLYRSGYAANSTAKSYFSCCYYFALPIIVNISVCQGAVIPDIVNDFAERAVKDVSDFVDNSLILHVAMKLYK